ncbi:MAG: trigger factor [Bacteroidetes bacterium]|nr:MAG: trigger factor [Bacteroidota bacterium]REK05121.1 MAG: trigger factor [Bacteroidota bacterium]REK32526.1 MAG: trigger factor [Bacteroidota bacterium]REK49027.1 MAG: trigger factor [Bacteroidota bacterium]
MMNITKEQVDALHAVVKIEVQPSDYQPRVNEVIKSYQKTANVPGFRPGKVPAGIIKKMYGKAVLVEELNKLLSESLGKYIYDNKLEVIGSPLPKKSEKEQVFEDGAGFEFSYELGIAPSFELRMPDSKIPYYVLKVDDKMVDDDITDIRRRYGKFSNPEVSEASHILYGEFTELNDDGEVKEGGNRTTTSLAIEMIRNEDFRKPFIGLKKGDTVRFNPLKSLPSEAEVAAMLRTGKDSPALSADYIFTVTTINQIDKAELNQELFDKLYGEGAVTTEEEFRNKVRESIAQYFVKESDRKLKKDLRNVLLEGNEIPLPDDFLKRMLKANQEKEKAEHEFDHEYYHLAEDLRWSLIQNKVASSNDIIISEEEVKALSVQVIRQQFAQYGYYEMEQDKLDEMSVRYLNEEGNYDRLERTLRENKVFEHLRQQIQLDNIELSYTDFVDKLREKTNHELEHH